MSRRAVFLDRDGVVNTRKNGYVNSPADLQLMPWAGAAIARLQAMGFATVLISNQGGVGKGYMGRDALVAITEALLDELAMDGAGFDGIYYCTHAPQAGCLCRKPRPGLLHRAALELDLDLRRSYFVGDMATDVEAGHWAGVPTIFVRSGGEAPPVEPAPWAVCDDLYDAVKQIRRTEWERSW